MDAKERADSRWLHHCLNDPTNRWIKTGERCGICGEYEDQSPQVPDGGVTDDVYAWKEPVNYAIPAFEVNRAEIEAALQTPIPPPSVKTAADLKAIIRAWLDADDPTHWGAFERGLNKLVEGGGG